MPEIIRINDGGIARNVSDAEIDVPRIRQIRQLMNDAAFVDMFNSPGIAARDQAFFAANQMAWTEQVAYEKQYVPVQYERLIPISIEAGPNAQAVAYYIKARYGRGEPASGSGTNIPFANSEVTRKESPVHEGHIGYSYTQSELRQAAFMQISLPADHAISAVEAWQRHMNDVALRGEAEKGITGLFNNPDVPIMTPLNGSWDTGTPDTWLRDINALINHAWRSSAFNRKIDTILVPPEVYEKLWEPRSANSDKTLFAWITENSMAMQDGIKLKIEPGLGLDTAGAGATRRMVGYINDRSHLVFHMPMPLTFLPPQYVGYVVQVPGEYKYSGVNVIYPKSMVYMDGI